MKKDNEYEISIASEGIFKMRVFEGYELELVDAKRIGVEFRKWAKGKKFAVLLDATVAFTVAPKAMKLFASEEFTKDRIAAAIYTTSLANKIAGNFFINVNKPSTPTKMFPDEASALKWLETEIKNYK